MGASGRMAVHGGRYTCQQMARLTERESSTIDCGALHGAGRAGAREGGKTRLSTVTSPVDEGYLWRWST